MKKIAVCISGQIRYWEETYPLFEYWNSLYDDIEFIFFLSTWKGKTWLDDKGHGRSNNFLVDYDYEKYDFLESYIKLDISNVKIIPYEVERWDRSNIKSLSYRSYAQKKCQELRKKFEEENNFIFDLVIQTRNDIFIEKRILNTCRDLVIINPYYLKDKFVFTPTGINLTKNLWLILNNDNFSFSNSKTMDIIKNLYDSLLANELLSKTLFQSSAEFYYRNNILCFASPAGNTFLIRDKKLIKNGRPTADSLKTLIKEKGVRWIYECDIKVLKREYWKYD